MMFASFYGKCEVCGNVGELFEVLLPDKDTERARQGYFRIDKMLCNKCITPCAKGESR